MLKYEHRDTEVVAEHLICESQFLQLSLCHLGIWVFPMIHMSYVQNWATPTVTFAMQAAQNHFNPFLWERLSQGLSVPMLESYAKAFCEWISYY